MGGNMLSPKYALRCSKCGKFYFYLYEENVCKDDGTELVPVKISKDSWEF
jgi:hypothetical protein